MPSYLDFPGLGYFARKIQAALDTKATKDAATQKADGLMTGADKSKMDGGVTDGITTAGTGAAYTAAVPGITALTTGVSFTMIVHTTSTSKTPTLDVNGLGAKQLRRRLSNMATSMEVGYVASWLASGKPFRVTYDGTYWVVDGHSKPAAADLYGNVEASKVSGLATVATSGSYNDLSNKPTAYSHPASHPASMITGLAKVATSGSYNDLSNKPAIPTTLPANGGNADTVDGKHASDFAAANHGHNYNDLSNKPNLATVATSGNYNDLSNKPTIPSIPASLPANGGNADTVDGKHASDFATSDHGHSYNDLSDKPTIPAAYSHPTTHPASMITGLATVATSGSYNDLSNKPTIPTIPSSLPANGGNADTVDGKHASDFATINGWVLNGESIVLPITGLFVKSAAYGNNVFVATNGYHLVYSTDGINWTKSPTSEIDHEGYWNLAYGNGIFVAISDEDSAAAYSMDGINWIATTTPLSTGCSSVTFGNGKFVATANGSLTAAAYSTDGINWSTMTMPRGNYKSVVYGADKFVAMGTSNYPKTYAAVSTDGINWTEKELSFTVLGPMLAYCNGMFAAVSYAGTSAAYSQDGVSWTSTTVTNASMLYGVTAGNGKILTVGSDSDNNNVIFYSTNGKDWIRVVLPFLGGSSSDSLQATTVIYGNNRFLAFAGNIGGSLRAAYSKDALTWVDQKYTITQDGADITDKVKAAIGA